MLVTRRPFFMSSFGDRLNRFLKRVYLSKTNELDGVPWVDVGRSKVLCSTDPQRETTFWLFARDIEIVQGCGNIDSAVSSANSTSLTLTEECGFRFGDYVQYKDAPNCKAARMRYNQPLDGGMSELIMVRKHISWDVCGGGRGRAGGSGRRAATGRGRRVGRPRRPAAAVLVRGGGGAYVALLDFARDEYAVQAPEARSVVGWCSAGPSGGTP